MSSANCHSVSDASPSCFQLVTVCYLPSVFSTTNQLLATDCKVQITVESLLSVNLHPLHLTSNHLYLPTVKCGSHEHYISRYRSHITCFCRVQFLFAIFLYPLGGSKLLCLRSVFVHAVLFLEKDTAKTEKSFVMLYICHAYR